jgi:protein required for attachment to host cells
MVNAEGRMADQDFVSDKPGRTVDGVRVQRHTLDPSVDPKERAAMQFARELADKLEAEHREKKFSRLIVVAAPHFLGLLRSQMSDALAGAVVHEVAKDLTREDVRTLQEHVASLT